MISQDSIPSQPQSSSYFALVADLALAAALTLMAILALVVVLDEVWAKAPSSSS